MRRVSNFVGLVWVVGCVANAAVGWGNVGGGGSSGGAPIGTVVNTGASVAGQVPVYADTTGTNVAPSLLIPAGFGNINIPLSGIVTVNYTNLASGNIDLYTVPAGKVAYIASFFVYNSTNTTTTVIPQIYFSGTYYRMGSSASVSATNSSSIGNLSYVFNSGEIISMNTSQTGITAELILMTVSTNYGLKGIFVLPSTGDNTIYTASGGPAYMFNINNTAALGGTISVFNNSGATRAYIVYSVPSGDSPTELTRVNNGTVTASSTTVGSLGTACVFVPNNGAIIVNVNDGTATQYIRGNILQL